jgi:hypothetical protein
MLVVVVVVSRWCLLRAPGLMARRLYPAQLKAQ